MRMIVRFLLLSSLLTTTSLVAGEGYFIATGGIRGDSGEIEKGVISTSGDAREWEAVFDGGKVNDQFTHGRDNMVRALTYGKGLFVAAGNQGIGVMTSSDGRSWDYVTEEPGEGPGGFTIAFDGDKFLLPTASHFHVSEDGRTWETTGMSGPLKELHGVGAWGADGAGHVRRVVGQDGVFVFAGERRFGSTKDGKTFLYHEILPPGEKQRYYQLLAGNGRFLYLNEGGHRTSTDGVNWEPLVIGPNTPEARKTQTQGVWTGNEFLVRGEGVIHRSEDGIEWESIPVESGDAALDTAGNDLLLGMTHQAFQISNDDGKSWKKIDRTVPSRQVYFFDGEEIIGSGGG